MGTSILLIPFIIPMVFAALVKMLFDAESRMELFNIFGKLFSEEAFEAYAEVFRNFTSPEFLEQIKEPVGQIIEGFLSLFS